MMKVLFILNSTKPDGSVISAMNLMRGLHERGVRCFVAQPDITTDPLFNEEMEGVVEKTFTVPVIPHVARRAADCKTFPQKLKHGLKENSFFWQIYTQPEMRGLNKVVNLVKPDIIHSNSGELHAGYFAAKKAGIPHVWHLREYQTKDFGHDILPSFDGFRDMLMDSYVITISKDLLDYFGLVNAPHATCIYNGCMSEKDTSFDYPKEPYFLCCSRVSPEKGHDNVIRAFSSFHRSNPEYRLVIAGNGPEEYIAHLKELASQGGCSERVEFLGFQDNVRPLMRKATALVVASVYEGFGRMTAEAAFCGCVVIGHNTGGTKEILDLTGGFPYEDDDGLLRQMQSVARLSDGEYRDLALHAQSSAVQHFSTEQNVDAVYGFYQRILAEWHRP